MGEVIYPDFSQSTQGAPGAHEAVIIPLPDERRHEGICASIKELANREGSISTDDLSYLDELISELQQHRWGAPPAIKLLALRVVARAQETHSLEQIIEYKSIAACCVDVALDRDTYPPTHPTVRGVRAIGIIALAATPGEYIGSPTP